MVLAILLHLIHNFLIVSTILIPTDTDLVRLSDSELPLFNYYGYPHIDPNTYEISWHVDGADYEKVMNKVK
jgi:hypothetical protein